MTPRVLVESWRQRADTSASGALLPFVQHRPPGGAPYSADVSPPASTNGPRRPHGDKVCKLCCTPAPGADAQKPSGGGLPSLPPRQGFQGGWDCATCGHSGMRAVLPRPGLARPARCRSFRALTGRPPT